MLRVRDLRIEKSGNTICRVRELDIHPGERLAVVGPNGSGKTTLLRVFGGLERNVAGECTIDPPLRNRVYVHQAPYLFRGSVKSNVAYGLAARNIARKDRLSEVRHWLDVFGVGHLAERSCCKLSGGEQRRVALARAFAVRADLMLLDEPLAELDEVAINIVCTAIANESESTIVIASPVSLPATLSVRTHQLAMPTC